MQAAELEALLNSMGAGLYQEPSLDKIDMGYRPPTYSVKSFLRRLQPNSKVELVVGRPTNPEDYTPIGMMYTAQQYGTPVFAKIL